MSEAWQIELVKGVLAILTPVLTAVLLYLVGRYLTDRYAAQKRQAELALVQAGQLAQKQRELQLAAAARFYDLYGEFFAVWKQWSAAKSGRVPPVQAPPHRQELFQRACVAEGCMEAILVRLTTEFDLDPSEIKTVATFRQAYQSIREAIRADRDLGWSYSGHPQYVAFKRLACTIASLLTRRGLGKVPTPEQAAAALLEVTSNKWEGVWDEVPPDAEPGAAPDRRGM